MDKEINLFVNKDIARQAYAFYITTEKGGQLAKPIKLDFVKPDYSGYLEPTFFIRMDHFERLANTMFKELEALGYRAPMPKTIDKHLQDMRTIVAKLLEVKLD